MDSTAVYQAVAGILETLPAGGRREHDVAVSVLLARQLEHAPRGAADKAALAHVLAEALRAGHDPRNVSRLPIAYRSQSRCWWLVGCNTYKSKIHV